MHPLRRFLAVLVVASLLVSDALTFWHVGNCACDDRCHAANQRNVAGQSVALACSPSEGSSCESGCDHAANPFVKRRVAREQSRSMASRELAGEDLLRTDSDHCGRDSQHHGNDSGDHDPGDCSLCRWLVTTRSGWTAQFQPVLIELAPLESTNFSAWSNPTTEPVHQELSRRGPPQLSSLS